MFPLQANVIQTLAKMVAHAFQIRQENGVQQEQYRLSSFALVEKSSLATTVRPVSFNFLVQHLITYVYMGFLIMQACSRISKIPALKLIKFKGLRGI